MSLKFLYGEPAVLVENALIVADLHVGIEYEFRRSGIRLPSNVDQMRKRLLILIKETGTERLILLGDVKHKVPGIT